MRIVGIFIAAFAFFFGFRMLLMAARTAISGKVLTRQGVRTKWQPAPTMNDAWKVAIRDALMGLLLIVLAVFLLT
jgi:hypothetical protein